MISLKDRLGDRKEVRLGDIVETYSGGTPNSSESKYYNGEINFIGSGEIGLLKTQKRISKEALNVSSAKLVETGDLLYALYGATSGKVAISAIDGAINQAVLCIKPEESKINKIYLFQLLRFNKNKILEKYLQGGQGNLSSAIIKNLKFNIIDINIQSQVANFLSSIDILIEKQEEYIKQLEVRKQVILRQVFNAENEDQMIKLLNVGNIVTGKTPSTKNKDFWNGTIPFITPTDMKNTKYILTERYVSIDFLNASYILPKESVCFTSIASIGKMCKTQEASITNQQINSIICNEHYNSDYVYYNLRYLVPKIKSTVISDGIAMINKTEFSTIKIKNVILEEQNKIASLLSSMDKLMN